MNVEPVTQPAGSASTDADVQPFTFTMLLQEARPEYEDKAKRVGEKFADALTAHPELTRALSYLAKDTPFMILIAPNQQRKIILPSNGHKLLARR